MAALAAKKEQRKLVESFQQLPGKHISNMYLGRKDDEPEHTAKSVYDEVKDMTSEEYTNYVLDARLKQERGEERAERNAMEKRTARKLRQRKPLKTQMFQNVLRKLI